MPVIFIETPRLVIRQWEEKDYESYINLNADPDVMEYFPSVKTPGETLAQVKRITEYIDQHGYGFWAVERKDNHQFIGFTGICEPGFQTHFTPCIEIGWRLSKENWGQGFATEAALASLDFGFEKLKLKKIYSFTSIHNHRSENVMQRIGMDKAGEFDHPLIADGHWLKKHVVYKIASNK
ncbi:MAG: GNAT family N-acetyltransferase [Bacteroidetes bacterium]|jgi:RimJ/RimL family protein N-acetyltransferase|nr:GNAT family N-acetyltransferase [Bacteroidota bacterium]